MTPQEAVRTLIQNSPQWSQNKLAVRLGLSPQAMVNRMKAAAGLRADFLAEIAEVFGCRLVIVPPEAKLPRGSIVIAHGEEQS